MAIILDKIIEIIDNGDIENDSNLPYPNESKMPTIDIYTQAGHQTFWICRNMSTEVECKWKEFQCGISGWLRHWFSRMEISTAWGAAAYGGVSLFGLLTRKLYQCNRKILGVTTRETREKQYHVHSSSMLLFHLWLQFTPWHDQLRFGFFHI